MIHSNFRIEILSIRALLCAIGSKGLNKPSAFHHFPSCMHNVLNGFEKKFTYTKLQASSSHILDINNVTGRQRLATVTAMGVDELYYKINVILVD